MSERQNRAGCSFPAIDLPATGRNIERLRIRSGYSVRQVQDLFGFSSPQAIYKWQWGLTLPSLDNMLILARLLGVAVEEVVVFKLPGSGKGE